MQHAASSTSRIALACNICTILRGPNYFDRISVFNSFFFFRIRALTTSPGNAFRTCTCLAFISATPSPLGSKSEISRTTSLLTGFIQPTAVFDYQLSACKLSPTQKTVDNLSINNLQYFRLEPLRFSIPIFTEKIFCRYSSLRT